MNASVAHKLVALRQDYQAVVGRPFDHFFCPMLYADERVALCEGHIINSAFRDASRSTTVQRKDIDNFYGSMFEADWLIIQERGQHTLPEVLADKGLTRKLRPQLWRNGEQVEHYVATSPSIPPHHTPIIVEGVDKAMQFVMKVDPSDAIADVDARWEISIERDLRLPALVSLLKAAHLTLFQILGYRYVFSPSGRYLGYDTLGRFFLQCRGLAKPDVLRRAREFFAQHVNIVRPVAGGPSLQGTLSDQMVSLCMPNPSAIWGMLVFVKLANSVHAVLVPTFTDAETAARYLRFLKSPFPRFETRLGRYKSGQWEVPKSSKIIDWPAASLD